jgi:hypothetical protein
MPVSVGLDASGNAHARAAEEAAGAGRRCIRRAGLKRAMDGKAEALFYDSTVKGATLAEGLQKALESLAKLPIPKVMTYQLAATAGPTSSSCAPRTAWWRCTAACRAARGAGPAGRPHHARPPLRGGEAHGELRRRRQLRAPRCEKDGAVIAGFESAAPRSSASCRKPRPRSAVAPSRSKTTRCSTK